MPDQMKRPCRSHEPLLAAALSAVAMTGCNSTMTSAHDPSPAGSDAVPTNMVPPPGHGPFTGTVADWPFWVARHEFGVSTYSTNGCKVIYNNFLRVNEPDDVLHSSSEPNGTQFPTNIKSATHMISKHHQTAI